MESQHQNPEFRINPENFHPCIHSRLSKLNPFIASHNVCHLLSHLLMFLGSLYCNQYGPSSEK